MSAGIGTDRTDRSDGVTTPGSLMMVVPENPEQPLKRGDSNRLVTEVIARDPGSVVCEETLFVNAVTTLGVPLISYAEYRPGEPEKAGYLRELCWKLGEKTIDGAYTFKELRQWWGDAAWLARNPTHELTVMHVYGHNLLRMAERIRVQPCMVRYVEKEGETTLTVTVPVGASVEERERLLGLFAEK